jgi:hypothetical protein
MTRFFILVVFLFTACSLFTFGYAQDQPLEMGQWLRDWLLCGPFPLQAPPENDPEITHLPGFENDFLIPVGGEQNPQIKAGTVLRYQDLERTWTSFTSRDSTIDLDHAVSDDAVVAAYGFKVVNVPRELVCFLSIGSNDGCRVWVNGTRVWDRPTPGGLFPDDKLVPVRLQQGRNTILVKVEERGNKWGFCMRFLPLDHPFRPAHFFHVLNTADGHAYIKFAYEDEAFDQLFESTELVVVSESKPDDVIYRTVVDQPLLQMDIPTDQYRDYSLTLTATLHDGQSYSETIPFHAGQRREYTLFDQGKTDYKIVLATEASESERWAAKELQQALHKIGGVSIAVIDETQLYDGPTIHIGVQRAMTRETDLQEPARTDESFIYTNKGKDIWIVGGRERGTLYGVMAFLENELGVRWYTPEVSVFPRREEVHFTRLYCQESPGIRVRNDFYFEAFDPIWAAHNRVNGAMTHREQPGGVEGYWSVHTFYRFMPPEEFFDEHPEYFSLIDGERIHERAQLCLSHPDVLDIITQRLKQTMRENPQYLIYSVSQNDWGNPCQCKECQAVVEQEKSEAGPVIKFVNRVAERIEDEFPDKYVGTLAYTYTRQPCKNFKPRHNVVVRLCSIECCFAHDFKSCPENQAFLQDLQGWAAIAPHLYIWDYVVNFSHYIMPYPNFNVLKSNIQTFQENKAIGIMEQAAYQSRGGEFSELRAFVLAKLLWNPKADVDSLVADFMVGYYGRSGVYVQEYFDLLHNRVGPEMHIHLGLQPEDKLFSEAFIRTADRLFDKAEIVADNESVRQRVQMARLPLDYLKCKRTPEKALSDGTYARFCEVVEREGITHYAERGEVHKNAFHLEMEQTKKRLQEIKFH